MAGADLALWVSGHLNSTFLTVVLSTSLQGFGKQPPPAPPPPATRLTPVEGRPGSGAGLTWGSVVLTATPCCWRTLARALLGSPASSPRGGSSYHPPDAQSGLRPVLYPAGSELFFSSF